MTYHILPGKTFPLGSHYDGSGTHFAIFSAHAEEIELCLFDASGMEEIQRLSLPTFQDDVFCGYVPDLQPGTLYGYRCYGQYAPEHGYRFNPNKLLLDPYARKLSGDLIYHPLHLDYVQQPPGKSWQMDEQDSAPVMPKAVVTIDEPDVEQFTSLKSNDQTVIYELHVRGFTQLNKKIDETIRGTYRALASDESIAHLKDLGVTSIELLPIHAVADEPFLRDKGLTNYWGYNNYHFFVFESSYAKHNAIEELRYLTKRMHHAGIEVIIDVVYNHTAEGSEFGPTYSLRGIDNIAYYRLNKKNRAHYLNHSGCGNALDLTHPRVLQLVMDSLRYLATKIGVDGFRYDLASVLGRDSQHKFDSESHFFSCLKQDPVLCRLKHISEPWDIGTGGYQLGQYPHDWYEWNDRFRDSVRRFWRGDMGVSPEFARRMHGSSDLFEHRARSPYASINFITAHDGMNLRDLVTYENKHNLANLEDNSDGHSANYSANYGVEGETDDPEINKLRLRQRKNLLASLFLAQGTPMMLAGDEMSHTQQGNNNCYCQNNEISWLNWDFDPGNDEIFQFCKKLIEVRQQHPLINRPAMPHGLVVSNRTGLSDISWFGLDGSPLQESSWRKPDLKTFAMMLAATQREPTSNLSEIICSLDDAVIILFNASDSDVSFNLPDQSGVWALEFDTAETITNSNDNKPYIEDLSVKLTAHSCAMYRYTHVQANHHNSELSHD
ncbi:MAG: glycogen debranching protein GlgX [Gammaproteobacteria bacterium]|nr:glycogen debranching protein GlgX [Gammaproteobacteria bacterium]